MDKKHTRSEKSAKRLAQAAQEGVAEVSPMSWMERSTEAEMRQFAQEAMDRKLSALPVESGKPMPCPKCGKPAGVRQKAVARTFQSLAGTHTLKRNYHYCEGCKGGFFPRDIELGLPAAGAFTEDLEARVLDFALNDPFGQAAARWRVHYGHLPLSDNAFRQVTRRAGEAVEATAPVLLQEAALPRPPEDAGDTLYVMTDGSHTPLVGEWKEAKLGLLFREGEAVRGDGEHRGVLLHPRYTAHVGPQDAFEPLLQAALQVELGAWPQRVAWLGDGAVGNWTLAQKLAPSAIQVLDWHHAVEHAVGLGKALLGEGSVYLPLWQHRMETLLLEGNVKALIHEAMDCLDGAPDDALGALNAFVGYVRENQNRMQYRAYREAGLLIGSGPVESAHRHVLQARMKRAGQRWSLQGAQRMARLRAHYRTAGPERCYASLKWAHRETLRLPTPTRTPRSRRRASNR